MKLDASPACEANGTSLGQWLRIGAEDTSDRLYWKFSADLLFAVRPSLGGRFVYEGINPAFESVLGIPTDEIGELDVSDCMGTDDAEAVCEALRTCLAEGTEIRIRHQLALGGARRDMETTIVPIIDPAGGGIVRLIGSHRAAGKGPFESLKGMDDVPVNVSLISIQEDIQQRIASDLHDSTCQHLIAASLGLMRVRTSLGDPAGAERICDDIDASIDEALREIRAFVYLLHPQNLTVDGLKATIENYAAGFAVRTSLRVATRIASEIDRLPYETQRSLLRVIQEALTNVFRHAKATKVRIDIDATSDHFRLTISDDGRGLSVHPAKPGAKAISMGVGIPAMKARLREIGGTLDIQSDSAMRHSGTVLRAVFPRGLAANKRNRRRTTSVVEGHAGTK
ncbi:ATP-binding protein [Bradyrhizobium liaoningense]|uniref:PAS domain-containing sensor histidine kinase n=1 Tax=Bradyrhizobium liaoningense TaxID=43992 RepID=UPI001BA86E20|nr:ATP-binding protein [Bradyrhizobium liaoningense]MBR0712394.1 ATP-binding protein [Bradyrhizobium liaoningense]